MVKARHALSIAFPPKRRGLVSPSLASHGFAPNRDTWDMGEAIMAEARP